MKKKIMIDMDDVIVSGGFLYLINKFLNKNYKEEDFNNFYMQDILPDKKSFYEFFLQHNLYDYCEIKEDAKEIIEELSKYYEIYICTSYIFKEIVDESGIILKYKYDYLLKNFSFLNPYNYIFTGNKNIVKTDIKIDDRIENLDNADLKLLFTAYHNKNITEEELKNKNIIRVDNWRDIKKILIKE